MSIKKCFIQERPQPFPPSVLLWSWKEVGGTDFSNFTGTTFRGHMWESGQ